MKCPHCETHIDEHKANRCLDAWIAEKVMGLQVAKSLVWQDGDWLIIPRYSTSRADAWLVVDKFMGRVVAIAVSPQPGGTGIWDCTIGTVAAEAPTAPEAICLAALKAVGHD